MAEARPYWLYVKASVYIWKTMVSVECAGPPLVSIWMTTQVWKTAIVCVTKRKKVEGLTRGQVIFQLTTRRGAPSMRAASEELLGNIADGGHIDDDREAEIDGKNDEHEPIQGPPGGEPGYRRDPDERDEIIQETVDGIEYPQPDHADDDPAHDYGK